MSLSPLAAADEAPAALAWIVDGVPFDHAAMALRVRRAMACLFPHRAGPVAVVATARLETLDALLALIQLGVPFWPIHPRLTAPERDTLLAVARPSLVLDEHWSAGASPAAASTAAPPDDQRPLAILATSGSTGRPKGVVLSRAAFAAAAAASADRLGWRADDRWLLCLPLAHIGGLSIVTRCLLARRTGVLVSRFTPDGVIEAIERDRVTLASLVPTQLEALLGRSWDPPPALRTILVGGAGTAPDLLARAVARGWPVVPSYGLTEACSQVATPVPGAPLAGLEVRISDGEIHLRGPQLFSGYVAEPTPFLEGGWFPTGDLGRLDEQGQLHVLGRRRELIITGGENVSPAEVERVLEAAPGIVTAIVFGIPDATWGELVCAALVGAFDESALAAHLAAHLAPHKRPRRIAVLEDLPLGPTGKPDRAAIVSIATSRLLSGSAR